MTNSLGNFRYFNKITGVEMREKCVAALDLGTLRDENLIFEIIQIKAIEKIRMFFIIAGLLYQKFRL